MSPGSPSQSIRHGHGLGLGRHSGRPGVPRLLLHPEGAADPLLLRGPHRVQDMQEEGDHVLSLGNIINVLIYLR